MILEIYANGSAGELIDSFDGDVVPEVGSVLVFNIIGQQHPDRYRVERVEHLFLTSQYGDGINSLDTRSVSVRCFVELLPRI